MAASPRFWTARMFACVLVLPLLASAQTLSTGRIVGQVADRQGALVPHAQVQVQDIASALKRTVESDATGRFAVGLLPPGTYDVIVSALGFATARLDRLCVTSNQTTTTNFSLSVAHAAAEIVVNDSPPLVESRGAQLATTIDSRTVSTLPLPTRNFLQLAALSPGVSVELANNSSLGRNSPNFSVNGARPEQNNVILNGIVASDLYGHDLAAVAVPAPESIQEVTILTSMYDASLKSAGGANVQVITKGGSDSLHGSVYEYFRNDALNANDPNLKQAAVRRPVLRQNVYGATLGGPIGEDRAFYFVSYQGTRQTNGATNQSIYKNILIAPGLTDDRSESTLLSSFHPVLPNGAPATSIDPIALKLLNYKLANGQFLIPTPQQADGRASGTAVSRYHEEQFNANVDFKFGAQDWLSEKSFFSNAPLFNALGGDSIGQTAFGDRVLPGFGTQVENDDRVFSLSHVHLFSPKALNEARVGYSLIGSRAMPQEAVLDSSIGMQRPTSHDFPGLPTILLARDAGGASIGSTWITLNQAAVYSWTVNDTLSMRRGNHELRLGGDFRYYWWNMHVNANTYGRIEFPTFRDFLVGDADTASIGVGMSRRHFRTSDYSLFVNDDWTPSRKLVINMGLRYELNLPPYETNGLIGGFDPSLYQPRMLAGPDGMPTGPPVSGFVMADNSPYVVQGVKKVGKRVVNSVSPRNFGPRIGFAWSLTHSGRIVLRGGYGVFFSEPSFFYLAWDYFSPPFYQNFVTSPHSLANPFPGVPDETSFPLLTDGVVSAITPMDPNLRTPYVHQFNASVEYEIFRDTVLQVAYVGARGKRLFRQRNFNQARIASVNHPIVNRVTHEVITENTSQNAPLRAPMPGIDIASVSLNQADARSAYNALQTSLVRHLSHGLQFQASYTYSKSIDDTSGPGLDTGALIGNQFTPNSNRGLSDFDRKHRLVSQLVWDMPNFTAGFGSLRQLLAGWQFSGIVTVMSGTPIDIFDPAGGSLYGLAGARPNWAPGAGPDSAMKNVPAGYYFNPFVFSQALVQPHHPIPSANDPTALAGALETDVGNVGRNVLRGPRQSNVDLSVAKRLTPSESHRLEFRVDIFNVFNHANRENPVSDLSVVTATGGSIDAVSGRIISPGDFGRCVGFSSSPRIVQLALKYSF